jgi:PAS domain S-box-containing protein
MPSEHNKAVQHLAAQYRVAHILAESLTLKEAGYNLLRSLAETLEFLWGGLWIVDKEANVLRCSDICNLQFDGTPTEFDQISLQTTFTSNIGLPGRVWASHKPAWIIDINSDNNFPRKPSASKEGLRSAVCCPIHSGSEVLGVFEFFSREIQEPDQPTILMLQTIADQLGQFIVRKRAEEALRESEGRFRTLAITASDAIILIDENSTMLFVNPAAERIFGYGASEMLGHSLTMLMPERLREQHDIGIKRYISTGNKNIPWTGIELVGQHKSGKEIPLEISFGEFGREGKHIFTGIARDISERKAIEAERLELLKHAEIARIEAEAANRAKDEFLATLSHELRTPLTPIVGWIHMMRGNMLPPKELEKGLSIIEASAQDLTRLIDDLLDMSTILSGNIHLDRAPVLIKDVIGSAIEFVQPQAIKYNISIETIFNLELLQILVLGDRVRLTQVFWNLLSNAIKFSFEGGKIKIKSRVEESDVLIDIEDQGHGIDPEFIPYVFDRFRQADSSISRKYGGMGLGLSLVKNFVEIHGGGVSIKSEGTGHGVCVTVRLPILLSPQKEVSLNETGDNSMQARGKSYEETENSGKHVLIIEDSPDTLNMLHQAFEINGYRTTLFQSAYEVLQAAQTLSCDIIVSDIGLPGMNGYELLKRLKSMPNFQNVPAIALTGYVRQSDIEMARNSGFDEHIAKPTDPTELIARVEALLGLQKG